MPPYKFPEKWPIDRANEVEDVPFLTKRAEDRSWLLANAKKGGIGAEIGVFRGHFAAVIARELKPKKLYLIDPWTKTGERFGWSDIDTNQDRLTTKQAMRETIDRMRPFASDSEIIFAEQWFADFAATYPGPKFDFVYLDSSHSYEGTREELSLLDLIIADDGVIMGDDWTPDPAHRHHGVMRAVHEFIKERNWHIVVAGPGLQYCLRRTPSYP